MTHSRQNRRQFLSSALGAMGGAFGISACQRAIAPTPVVIPDGPSPLSPETSSSDATSTIIQSTVTQISEAIPERTLGKTGLILPVLGLGGSASPLSRTQDEAEALAIIHRALDLGVRYFDTAASYGPSEVYLGQVLPAHRSEVSIATKTIRRQYDEAWRDLERSLERLQTNTIDLWQFHGLTNDSDLETLLHPQTGAIKAAQEAQAQGLVRYLGVTGHNNPGVIVSALQRYPFDTALVPINAADRHTPQPFITTVLPVAQQQQVGIIAMKVPAYGRLFKPGVLSGMPEAMGYALSQPGVQTCIIAAETVAQLEENVATARAFQPLDADALADIEERTASVWQENSFFRRWT
ncbi:MAG: aldo/keto reductase [Cyanobacteria bacterium P01_D01_bin.128]